MIAILLLSCCVGCEKQSEVVISGDKLTIPADPKLTKVYTEYKDTMLEYTKFDGAYPTDWPKGLDLPAGVYLRNPPLVLAESANERSQSMGLRMIQFNGIAPMNNKETVEHFRKELLDCGFVLVTDSEQKEKATEYSPAVHTYRLSTEARSDKRVAQVMILVMFRRDLQEWTDYWGHITIDINK